MGWVTGTKSIIVGGWGNNGAGAPQKGRRGSKGAEAHQTETRDMEGEKETS